MNKLELAETTTDPKILDELSKDEDFYVRRCVARNSNTTSETLDYLSSDEDSDVRCYVARNPNTTSEILDYLSKDENSGVRYWVAQNHNCSMKAYKYIKGLELLSSFQEPLECRSNQLQVISHEELFIMDF